ncbi:MAG: MurR/RpiR family transcriptional regulator, partial [Clostridiales bacterium]|nr:MurR/RpiR family transcriptional regulator [Clostridiales bacterium]
MNFEERVLLNELRLTDTDDQVVDYIREDYNRFVNQSVQKVAEDLFTVPNTIVRLSKKLGYKGFSDLKFSL